MSLIGMWRGLSPLQRQWKKKASELPPTGFAVCNYWQQGWPQSCGTGMHWRVTRSKKNRYERRIEFICGSCGNRYEYEGRTHEMLGCLLLESYENHTLSFENFDRAKVGF